MIILTGGAGFIGANLLRALNARGESNIVVVDNLSRDEKAANLAGCRFAQYWDKTNFLEAWQRGVFDDGLKAVFHQGACSDTMEQNQAYITANNLDYTVALFERCQRLKVPLIYASSAAVYGNHTTFVERPEFEAPLNIYGQSKLDFDNVLRSRLSTLTAPVVGLRYFNVYGPHEQHKGRMASVAWHSMGQLKREGYLKLFEGYGGYAAGEQLRDFVSVFDVVAVNLWMLDHPEVSGIFNCGTGQAQSFNELALAVINSRGNSKLTLAQAVEQGLIRYIDFPEALKGKYQSYTQADVSKLRAAGYRAPFLTVDEGVGRYVDALKSGTP